MHSTQMKTCNIYIISMHDCQVMYCVLMTFCSTPHKYTAVGATGAMTAPVLAPAGMERDFASGHVTLRSEVSTGRTVQETAPRSHRASRETVQVNRA